MRKFHVKVTYAPWKGDRRVGFWENDCMLVTSVEINHEQVEATEVRLSLGSGIPSNEGAGACGFLVLELIGAEEYRKRLKPEEWLQHDDPNVLALAVANVKFVEAPVPVKATIARANAE